MESLKIKNRVIIFFSAITILLLTSSCGAKKSGCGLTSDANHPVKTSTIICENN